MKIMMSSIFLRKPLQFNCRTEFTYRFHILSIVIGAAVVVVTDIATVWARFTVLICLDGGADEGVVY